jgi:geranylgeranyl pyrophosphate synthase
LESKALVGEVNASLEAFLAAQFKQVSHAGQFLDALAQARQSVDVAETLLVVGHKTSTYPTVRRQLLLGAGAAGATKSTTAALAPYGVALGEAFQLRDDLGRERELLRSRIGTAAHPRA